MFLNPTITDFKARFVRDFPFNSDINLGITDQDIANAYADVDVNFNQDLWAQQADYTNGYLLLAAHYLVLSLRASSQGINGQYNWIQTNKSVQGVSEGFSIPQRILDNPEFAMLAKTNYGAKFLSFVLPQLSGQIFSVCGSTQP